MGNVGNYNHSVSKLACEMLQFYLLEIYGVEMASFQTYQFCSRLFVTLLLDITYCSTITLQLLMFCYYFFSKYSSRYER